MNPKVKLLLVPAVVAAMGLSTTGCEPSQPSTADIRVCVDKNTMKRVDDTQCAQSYQSNNSSLTPMLYYWWFMRGTTYYPAVGYDVRQGGYAGGSFYNPSLASSYRSFASAPATVSAGGSGSISRGGFGSSARGFSGGSSGG